MVCVAEASFGYHSVLRTSQHQQSVRGSESSVVQGSRQKLWPYRETVVKNSLSDA